MGLTKLNRVKENEMSKAVDKLICNNNNPSKYLYNLSQRKNRKGLRVSKEREDIIKYDPECAYKYARDIIGGRWLEAEPYIMKDPEWATWYAHDILQKRWEEAEPYIVNNPNWAHNYASSLMNNLNEFKEAVKIAKQDKIYARLYYRDDNIIDVDKLLSNDDSASIILDKATYYGRMPIYENILLEPSYIYEYARYIIKGRWLRAEPIIMKNSGWAYEYARDILKKRWEEAEEYVIKSPRYAYLYARDVMKNRWREAEPYIIKNPELAYWYVKDIIKKRWREAEEYIKKDDYWWGRYCDRFGIEN